MEGSEDGGPEYVGWPEETAEASAEQSAGSALCNGLALTIDTVLLALTPKPTKSESSRKLASEDAAAREIGNTPSQALVKEMVQRTGHGLSSFMSVASIELQKASDSVTASVERWVEEKEDARRRRIVQRLVRKAFSKVQKQVTAERLHQHPFPGLSFIGSAKLLEGPMHAQDEGQGVGKHMVSIATWEEGADMEIVHAYTAFTGYRVVAQLETEAIEAVNITGPGLLRFRRWACRLKGWRIPGQVTPRLIILGTYGVLKCMSGQGLRPSEKSIKYQAHQYMSNLGAAYYGVDYMGHGPPEQKMPGNGFMVSSTKLHLVMKQCLEILSTQFPRVPIFLHGECYGAMLSLSLALDDSCMAHVSGIIHNSAPIYRRGITDAAGVIPRSLIQVADWMLPPWYAQRFLEEKQVGPMPGWFLAESPQTWNDAVKLADHCKRHLRHIFRRVPTLGIYSLEDPLVSVPATMESFHVAVEESVWAQSPSSTADSSIEASTRSASAADDLLPRAPITSRGPASVDLASLGTSDCGFGTSSRAQSAGVEMSMIVSFDEDDNHLIRDSALHRDCARKLECAWMNAVMEHRTLDPLP